MLRHDGLLCDVLEGCWVKEQEKEGYNLLERNRYEESNEDGSIWRTIRNHHKPASQADD